MKKWLFILLALGFAFTNVYAYDDDEEYEDEDEEPAPKKKTAPKKKAAEKPAAPGRFGLAVGFDGNSGLISLVYDMGTGIELGLGLGLYRFSQTKDPAPDPAPEPAQRVEVVPSISYGLGKGLLNYGIGASLGITIEPVGGNRPDGGTSIYVYPNFYTNVELVKNVSLGLSAGFNVDMPAETQETQVTPGNPPVTVKEMRINARANGTVSFYFL
ncbi:hypothetical protein R83H12_00773 [Fibrobacteria bacterium R8-3-H12]